MNEHLNPSASAVMRGFPPAEADRATLANWRRRPYSAWAFHHVREIVPTAEIAHDPDAVWRLDAGALALDGALIDAAMDRASADAVAIVHRGALVYEQYRNGMTAADPHILMSVSKSILGLVAGTLVERGELAERDRAEAHLPEIVGSAFEGATIRDLLDMRTGVAFDEDYLATSGPIVDYRRATNWNPPEDGAPPGDLRGFLAGMAGRDRPHGGPVRYVSPNSDLLGWIFERASGLRYADLLSRRLLRPMGAERPGALTVDRIGGARAAGGVCLTARDLARVGMLMAEGGRRGAAQVIPESWIDDIETAGDPAAWAAGDLAAKFPGRDVVYRSKWYVHRGPAPLIHGLGIHGQYLFVDRARRLSVAWFSSADLPLDETHFPTVMTAIDHIREVAS